MGIWEKSSPNHSTTNGNSVKEINFFITVFLMKKQKGERGKESSCGFLHSSSQLPGLPGGNFLSDLWILKDDFKITF